MTHFVFTRRLAGWTILLLTAFFVAAPARATTFNMPDQDGCDNGSTTLTWVGEGVTRPQIASMTVDGQAIADPAHPGLNSLGAVVCPSTTKGNRTSVTVIFHTASGNTSDLTDAVTPTGDPVTSSTAIAISMTDLGQNAAHFTFSLVYGQVLSWTTGGLGTSSASVNATFSPVRTPQGSGDSFGGCSAVPPTCTAAKSDEDVLGVTFGLSFEPNVGTQMAGSYFALTGAMGGYVTSATATDGSKTLVASIGAPHFLADGTTLNSGSMTAFLPSAVVASLFGLPTTDLDTTTLDILRTSGSTTTSAVPFTIATVPGGVTLTVPTITFSSPKYTVKMTAAGLQKQKMVAVTPSPSKSTITVIGSKVKANGVASYKVQVVVRNRLGKVLKIKPILVSTPGIQVSVPTYKNGAWTFKLSTKKVGTKTIKVSANAHGLKTIHLNFIKP